MKLRICLYGDLAALLITVIFSCTACGPSSGKMEHREIPNFVVIFTDELQFSDLGCYGGKIPTPNIDRLASGGMLFSRAYTPSSMCTPSRYAVLTGQFPGRCSAPSFLHDNPPDQPYNIAWNTWITEDKKPLPKILSENGFITGMAGKWHVGRIPQGTVLPQFEQDEALDDPETEAKLARQQSIYQDLVKQIGGFDEAASVVWGNYDGIRLRALQFHNFPWMVKGALTFIEEHRQGDQPFFLYFAPTAVHGPNHVDDLSRDVSYTPGGRDTTLFRLQIDIPALKEQLSRVEPGKRHRYAGLAQTDHIVGLILDKLEESGLVDKTVIIFMSDHNVEPGKATSFEKGIHVPMIVCWPGLTTGNSSRALVQNMDIYPTILEAAGIALPDDQILDGVSMMPILADPERSIRDYIFSENGYTRSVCDGTYKYIALRYPAPLIDQMASGKIDYVPSYVGAWPQAHSAIAMNCFPGYFEQDQVYDLQNDPYEQENIYSKMKGTEEFKSLKAALVTHLASFGHPFDLTPIAFMETDRYKKLTDKNLAFDLHSIPWLSRDHGTITWPPAGD